MLETLIWFWRVGGALQVKAIPLICSFTAEVLCPCTRACRTLMHLSSLISFHQEGGKLQDDCDFLAQGKPLEYDVFEC